MVAIIPGLRIEGRFGFQSIFEVSVFYSVAVHRLVSVIVVIAVTVNI